MHKRYCCKSIQQKAIKKPNCLAGSLRTRADTALMSGYSVLSNHQSGGGK